MEGMPDRQEPQGQDFGFTDLGFYGSSRLHFFLFDLLASSMTLCPLSANISKGGAASCLFSTLYNFGLVKPGFRAWPGFCSLRDSDYPCASMCISVQKKSHSHDVVENGALSLHKSQALDGQNTLHVL